jgi:uncharacterized membrane protein
MLEAAPRRFHPMVLVPFCITFAWVLIQFLAPLSLPAGSVKDLSGVVGKVDNANQTAKMNPFARWVYEGGDVNCHQKASRSLFVNGNEMPYCSRDLGIFIGMMLGCGLGLYIVLDLKAWYIIGGLTPLGIDGVGQLMGLWESTNPVRLLTGGLAGLITGIALAFIFYVVEDYLRDRRKAKRALKGPETVDGEPGTGPPSAGTAKAAAGSVDAWMEKGMALHEAGKPAESLICFDRVIELDADNAGAWSGKAGALLDLGKPLEAIMCADSAIEIKPAFAGAWNVKGMALRALGRPEAAAECFDKALEIDPENDKARENRSSASGTRGGPPGAQRPEGDVGQEKDAQQRQPDGLEEVHGAEKADDGKHDG